jgi:glycerophosphoryl diester phosphodiesterase
MPQPAAWPCLLVLALSGCTLPDAPHVQVIGHGGMGADSEWPMNSGPSLAAALAAGVHGVELDVQLTADSVLVAYHDELLDGNSACSGKVNALTWAQLQQCPVLQDGATFPFVRVDALLLAYADTHPDATFTLDCKLFAAGDWWTYLQTYARALARLNARWPGRLTAECQVNDLLRLTQEEAPDLALFLYGTESDAAIRRAATSHYAGVTMHHAAIRAEEVRMAQELGLQVAVFGVGGWIGHYRALRKGVDRLQTDAPLEALAGIGR